ncbi:Outer membrane protein [Flavobacterium beibuense]|uniref:Outer membrane protein n=1 Tax=Flavobacterium beibuense TaxID=657326 RepID=A0A444WI85_9FLAO|nr:Outer membrane protein [Flavobacterium beibuense]
MPSYIFCTFFTLLLPDKIFKLRHFFTIYIVLLFSVSATAQNFYLKVEGKNETETKTIDSIGYNKSHENAKLAKDETDRIVSVLQRRGYFETHISNYSKPNDSTFLYHLNVGNRTNTLYIYTGKLSENEKELLNIKKDTITTTPGEVESFMNSSIKLLEQKGYSISSLKLTEHTSKGNSLYTTLKLKTDKKRSIDGLAIQGYDKFPEGIRRNILKQYKGKVFNQNNLERIYKDFNALRFVNQVRYPEILFKEDSTKVYVYLEKGRPNTFDGFIGFTNDEESNIIFNGYIDILLNNVLNSGEKFNLFWKSDGQKQTTFNAALELPYIFKSPLGVKGSLKIFKQDSTFQNTSTDLNLGYYFSYNSKLFLGRQTTESVDIQNTNTSTLSDFSNRFWTSTYEFTNYNIDDFLFPEKTILQLKAGIGTRDSKAGNSNQHFAQINAAYNFYLNKRNIINLKNQTYYLKSDSYIVSELFRFGGITSIRGFNENSLQANLFSAIMSEYRFVLAQNMYLHSITDYGYYQDETSDTNNNLLSFGFGFGLLTKTGLFNIIYANGSTKGQTIKLSNSIVHISFKTTF